MKTILTNKTPITAKDGKEYVVYNGFAEDGSPVQAFLSKQQADEFALADKAIVPRETIKEMFQNLEVTEIDFNQRGRVVAMSL